MEYENFDSHLAEFENSDEFDPSDAAVDSYCLAHEGTGYDPFDGESPMDVLAGSEEDIMEAEIRRTYLDAFPWDDA